MFGSVTLEPVLAAKRIFDQRQITVARQPIRAFPAVFCAKASASCSKLLVKRTLAHATSGLEFAIRPGHLIMKAEDFGDAFAQEVTVVRPGSKSANVNRPE